MHRQRKIVIGVGGNVGAGKTTACKIFEHFGAHYISADEIGWKVLREITHALKKKFGDIIMNGETIDKEKLRDVVFAKEEHLEFLNKLSHPLLEKKILEKMKNIKSGVLILDAALLFDFRLVYKHVDYPILITADDALKKKRAGAKGIDSVLFKKILGFQKNETEMLRQAKYVIKNNGTIDALKEQCQTIYEAIKNDC